MVATDKPDDNDAPLFEACRAFDELERQSQALSGEGEEIFGQLDEISERQRPLLDVMVEHRCRSLDGLRARARSLVLWLRLADSRLEEDAAAGGWEALLSRAILRDLSDDPDLSA